MVVAFDRTFDYRKLNISFQAIKLGAHFVATNPDRTCPVGKLGGVVLDRRLFTSMSYPADYGFVEGTLGEDGDPLDALVLVADPTFPGCRIRVRPVGVFHMTDEKGPDEKLICVPLRDPVWANVHDIHDVAAPYRQEIEHFFQVYKDHRGEAHGDARFRQPRRCAGSAGGRAGPS